MILCVLRREWEISESQRIRPHVSRIIRMQKTLSDPGLSEGELGGDAKLWRR